jgi:hypothetical protein
MQNRLLRKRVGKKLNSQHQTLSEKTQERQQRLKVGVGATKHLPKQGKLWIPELISWTRGQYSKPNFPTLLGAEQTRENSN